MMENSGQGAVVDLTAIPTPPAIDWVDWLVCFQSFSFILAVAPSNTEEVLSLFRERNLTAAAIGKVTREPRVILTDGRGEEPLFDWEREKITGIRFAE
jgi:hypothetical protein